MPLRDGIAINRLSRTLDCGWHSHIRQSEWAFPQLREAMRAWEHVFNDVFSPGPPELGGTDDAIGAAAVAVLSEFARHLQQISSRIDATTAQIDQTMQRLAEQQQEIEVLKRQVDLA